MAVRLRDYQEHGIADLRAAIADGARAPLYVLPTGGGKTTVFGELSRRSIVKGRRVVVLAHRKELVEQAAGRLRLLGLNPGLIMPGGTPGDGSSYCASVQTLVRDIGAIEPPDLLICDEAHHAPAGSWQAIRQAWPNATYLGVTATPIRLDGRGLGDAFDRMVLGPSARELTERGYLVPADVFCPSVPDLAGLRTRCGDWTTADLEKAIAESSIVGDAVQSFRQHVPSGSAVAFCASVAHARVTAAAFEAAGIRAAVLTGGDKKEHREAVLDGLASGAIRILCSVDVISEGFDLPDIRAAILLRPTKSLGLYLQQVGRALRPADGKTAAIILDHAGNALRHGLPAEDRQWSLDGIQAGARETTHTEGGEALSVRQCLTCYAIHPSGPVCPYCGTGHPRDDRIPRQRAGELRRLEAEEAARLEEERKAEAKAARVLPRFVFEKMAKSKGWKPGQAGEAHRRHVEKKAKAAGRDGGSSVRQADWLQGRL